MTDTNISTLYEEAKAQYDSDIEEIDEKSVVDVSQKTTIRGYALIGGLRLKLLFIPFYYYFFRKKYLHQYYEAFSSVIDEISRNKVILQLFSAYDVKICKKFGYYMFGATYVVPEEFNEASIGMAERSELVIQHFQESAVKLVDDIYSTKLVDMLNIDSLSNVYNLEMHLEPLGFYELVALDRLKSIVRRNMIIYSLVLLLISIISFKILY